MACGGELSSPGGAGGALGGSAGLGGAGGFGGFGGLADNPNTTLPFEGQLPATLSETGAFIDMAEQTPAEGVHAYTPTYPLWSNGSEKRRAVAITTERAPRPSLAGDDALFFKTFRYNDEPLETRIIRLTDGVVEYATYLWNDTGTDATKLDGANSLSVEVAVDGMSFAHEIPSNRKCAGCHEPSPSPILGYTEEQLGGDLTDAVLERDLDVTGYALGNCVHCHNGSGREGASFDMRPQVFANNVIRRNTQGSGAAPGVRVLPGDADNSVLFRAMTRVDGEARPMPPLGVQRRDDGALAMFRTWIDALPPDAGTGGTGGSAGTGGSSGSGGSGGSAGTGGMPPAGAYVFMDITLSQPLSEITSLRFIPGTTELLILTRTGPVHHYDLDTAAGTAERLGGFTVPDVHVETDCGFLSLTFDPDYANNDRIYLGHCTSTQSSAVTRVEFDRASPNYNGVAATALQLFEIVEPVAFNAFHNIGSIGFDQDGYFYAFMGDKTLGGNAQQTDNPKGAMLRLQINTDGTVQGAPGNPFLNDPPNDPYIYAYGLRSPWMGFVDPAGRYWIGDVGEGLHEEVNIITAPGQNLGWMTHEGPCTGNNCAGFTDPLVFWDRDLDHPYISEDPEASITSSRVGWAGLMYSGAIDRYGGGLTGKVVFGDMCVGFVRALGVNASSAVVSDEAIGHLANATGWVEGPDGYIYATTFSDRCSTAPGATYGNGRLVRLLRN